VGDARFDAEARKREVSWRSCYIPHAAAAAAARHRVDVRAAAEAIKAASGSRIRLTPMEKHTPCVTRYFHSFIDPCAAAISQLAMELLFKRRLCVFACVRVCYY